MRVHTHTRQLALLRDQSNVCNIHVNVAKHFENKASLRSNDECSYKVYIFITDVYLCIVYIYRSCVAG